MTFQTWDFSCDDLSMCDCVSTVTDTIECHKGHMGKVLENLRCFHIILISNLEVKFELEGSLQKKGKEK